MSTDPATESTSVSVEQSWKAVCRGLTVIGTAAATLENSQHINDVITSILEYLKSLTAALLISGVSQVSQPPKEVQYVAPTSRVHEFNTMRNLLHATLNALIKERQSKQSGITETAHLASVIQTLRTEVNVSEVFAQRVSELQAQMCLLEGAEDYASRGFPEVPKQIKSIQEMQRLMIAMKEKSDELKAENMKLVSDKTALLVDKSILLERVKFLESQVHTYMMENGRRRASTTHQTPHHDHVILGGVEIEPDVVAWLREMYVTLKKERQHTVSALVDENPRDKSSMNGQVEETRPVGKKFGDLTGKKGIKFSQFVESQRKPGM